MTNKETACSAAEILTLVSRRLQFRPASSVVSGHFIRDSKNNRYIPSGVMSKKFGIVHGPSGLNSHIRRGRHLQGRARRTSMTCITLTRLTSLLRRSQMRLCNVGTSLAGPQSSPLLTHDDNRCGGPEWKMGGGLCLLPLGAVI